MNQNLTGIYFYLTTALTYDKFIQSDQKTQAILNKEEFSISINGTEHKFKFIKYNNG